jgi:hypothetical protein
MRSAVALTLLVLGGLVGCGRSGDEPAAAPVPAPPATMEETVVEETAAPASLDACALVTKPEAEKLAGTPLDDAAPIRETCTYTGPPTGPTAQVEVYVGDGAKKYLDIERDLGHELRPLAGVGEEAYASIEAVFVLKAGVWATVRLVRLNDPAENRKPLENIARTVAERM